MIGLTRRSRHFFTSEGSSKTPTDIILEFKHPKVQSTVPILRVQRTPQHLYKIASTTPLGTEGHIISSNKEINLEIKRKAIS